MTRHDVLQIRLDPTATPTRPSTRHPSISVRLVQVRHAEPQVLIESARRLFQLVLEQPQATGLLEGNVL